MNFRSVIRRFQWIIPAAVGLLVIIVGAIRVISSGARLIGDRAVLALQVADITQGHLPALGQYSWHGWSHPGAALFYLLAPFSWLSGGDSWGVVLGVSMMSAVCLLFSAWLAFRRAGVVASCAAVLVMLLTWAASERMTPVDPWTPLIAVSIFVVFMMAVWGTVERDRAAVWILIFSGALVVQIHVGYAPLIGSIGLLALGLYWWTGGNPRAIARPMATSMVLFLPWLTNIGAVIRNLGEIANFLASTAASSKGVLASIGISRALGAMSFEFSSRASWLRGPAETEIIGEAPTATLWWLVAVIAGLLLTTVVTYRATHHRDGGPQIESIVMRRLWTLAPVVWVSLVIAILSVSRVKGPLYPYVVLWRAIIALSVLGWILAVIVAVVGLKRRLLLIVATLGVIIAGGAALTPISRYNTVTENVVAVERAIDQARVYLEQNTSPSNDQSERTIRLTLGDAGLVGLYPAIVWELEHWNISSGIDAETEWVFGDRVVPLGDETTIWMVCDTGIAWSLLSAAPGAEIVSLVSPFTADTEARVASLQIFIAEQLRSAGRIDALSTLDSPLVALALSDLIDQGLVDGQAVEELAAFNILTPTPGRRFGIVAFEPGTTPEIWWPLEVF